MGLYKVKPGPSGNPTEPEKETCGSPQMSPRLRVDFLRKQPQDSARNGFLSWCSKPLRCKNWGIIHTLAAQVPRLTTADHQDDVGGHGGGGHGGGGLVVGLGGHHGHPQVGVGGEDRRDLPEQGGGDQEPQGVGLQQEGQG